jgi:hypothetical protein
MRFAFTHRKNGKKGPGETGLAPAVKSLETGLECTVRVCECRVCAIAYIGQEATLAYKPAGPSVRQRTDRGLARRALSLLLTLSAHPASFSPAANRLPGVFIMNKFSRVSVLFAAVALTALAGCASTQKHESAGQYVDDSAITTKVKAAIFNEPSLKSAEINVETFKGRVQLSGFVSSRASIDRAVIVAQGVAGVTSVGNDMRLK